MKVTVARRRVEVTPGVPVAVAVTIHNDQTVIAGFAVRVLGADPAWVALDADQVSLFPDETRVVQAQLTVPPQLPAGTARVAVQVRELTPPDATSITDIDLVVPERRSVRAHLDPMSVTAVRRANYSLLVENTGNTVLRARVAGDDPEAKVTFRCLPPVVTLPPGAHAVVDVRAGARPPWLGSPAVRVLGLHLDDVDDTPTPGTARARSVRAPAPTTASTVVDAPARGEVLPVASATFVQKPLVSRGSVSLLGLLATVTVFALVVTVALSRLVGASAADRDLALAVAQAGQGDAGQGTAAIGGTVTQLTNRQPVAAVSVGVFAADDTDQPVATAATDANGDYVVTGLAAGDYKVAFRGAGYQQVWSGGASTAADATTLSLAGGQQQGGVDAALGGVPASIAGTVTGDDVGAATLYLETVTDPTSTTPPALESESDSSAVGAGGATPGARSVPLAPGAAIVRSVPIGTDGAFTLTDVPSPSVYDLVVAKVGYATAVQRVDVAAGEARDGVSVLLVVGDGVISGTTSTPTGPLGGVTLVATSGQSTSSTVSLADGSFTLRRLPTPATVTVTASLVGWNDATQVITLTQGQTLTGFSAVLTQASGVLSGEVGTAADGAGAGGVTVVVTNGDTTVQTVTDSGTDAGAWEVGDLPVPSTYTVTFSRPDLASQTVSVALDSSGTLAGDGPGSTVKGGRLQIQLVTATAQVKGKVYQRGVPGETGDQLLGNVTVTFTLGSTRYVVTSASVPAGDEDPDHGVGCFAASGLPPGTYTVSATSADAAPSVTTVSLAAGDVTTLKPIYLDPPATISGTVLEKNAAGVKVSLSTNTPVVRLYAASTYPGTELADVVARCSETDDGACLTATFDFGEQPAPQTYVVEVSTPEGQVLGSTTVVLAAGITTPIKVVIQE